MQPAASGRRRSVVGASRKARPNRSWGVLHRPGSFCMVSSRRCPLRPCDRYAGRRNVADHKQNRQCLSLILHHQRAASPRDFIDWRGTPICPGERPGITTRLKRLTGCPYLVVVAPGQMPGVAEPKGKDLCPQLQSRGAAIAAVPIASQRCVLTPMRRFELSSLASTI